MIWHGEAKTQEPTSKPKLPLTSDQSGPSCINLESATVPEHALRYAAPESKPGQKTRKRCRNAAGEKDEVAQKNEAGGKDATAPKNAAGQKDAVASKEVAAETDAAGQTDAADEKEAAAHKDAAAQKEKREMCYQTMRIIGPTADEPQEIRNLHEKRLPCDPLEKDAAAQNAAARKEEAGTSNHSKRIIGPRVDEPLEIRNLPMFYLKMKAAKVPKDTFPGESLQKVPEDAVLGESRGQVPKDALLGEPCEARKEAIPGEACENLGSRTGKNEWLPCNLEDALKTYKGIQSCPTDAKDGPFRISWRIVRKKYEKTYFLWICVRKHQETHFLEKRAKKTRGRKT